MTNEELVYEIRNNSDVDHNLEQLYIKNLGLIRKAANRYSKYADFDDLQQEAYFGLLIAVNSWSDDTGTRFSSFAYICICQVLYRYAEKNSLIKVSRDRKKQILQYKKAVHEFSIEHMRDPSPSELSEILGLSPDQIEQIRIDAMVLSPSSLDKMVRESEDGSVKSLGEMIEDDRDQIGDALNQMEYEQIAPTLWSAVHDLKPRQEAIIRDRYKNNQTLQACADALGLSRERVRQIEKRALFELRKSRKLSPYIETKSEAMAYNHTGLHSFCQTWESSPERVALFIDAYEHGSA